MMPRARFFISLFTVPLIPLVSGCGKWISHTSSSVTSTPSQVITTPMTLPDAFANTAVLLEVAPTHGDQVAGEFKAESGTLWVSLDCQGPGEVTVDMEPGNQFINSCTPGEISRQRHGIEINQPGQMKVRVSSPVEVR